MNTPKAQKTHQLFQSNLPFFARKALIIKNKETGALEPFVFNYAQEYLHSKIEAQLATKGWVRIIILKGRQQGMSTYTAARYYHKCTRNKGQAVFILSHEFQTTGKLFSMVDRFHQNCPDVLKPHTGTYNNKQIKFDHIDSEYTTGTAGNEDVGRGGTLQLFHGSECGFWDNTDGIETGIMQSIADVPGTEIILESTANGMGNMFHRKCMSALRNEGDYELVFIPWFWQREYRRVPPEDFHYDEQEYRLQKAFKLEPSQIYWRRKKIEEFGSEWKFRQEYPMTVQDAFVTSGSSLINQDSIIEARKAKLIDPRAPLILGVDMGRTNDRVVIAPRRGREVQPLLILDPKKEGLVDQMYVAGRIATMIERKNVAKVFIDAGLGYGTIDRLKELGFGDTVQGVYFGERPMEPEKFLNKRAEIYLALRDWLDPGGVSLPDDEELQVDLASIPDFKTTSRGLIQMPSKEDIKKMLGRSPDVADALCLTFAYPVSTNIVNRQDKVRKVVRNNNPFKISRRINAGRQTEARTTFSLLG